jgi:virginiamycin B lyase
MPRKLLIAVAVAALIILLAAIGMRGIPAVGTEPATSAPPTSDSLAPVAITEWTVPWAKSRPRDPHLDGQGRVWFVGQGGNYIAYLEPKAGTFKRFEIDSGTHPHNLIVDGAGMVWYAGNRNAMIGKLDPATGAVTRYPMPEAIGDPHTLVQDAAGTIWFTAQQSGYVGRLDTATGKVDAIPTPTAESRPYGIIVGRNGRIWFNEFGVNKLASIDPGSLAVTEHPQPNERTRARRLAQASDGAIWYVDYIRGMLGRFDPAGGKFAEWPTPGGAPSLPYAMGVDDRDRLWYVESGMRPNRLVGFDATTRRVVSITPFGAKSNTVRHLYFDPKARELWFGTDANTIARAKLP